MKDAYSFHLNQQDLETYYEKVLQGYNKIYSRIGLKNFISVKSDSGMMGGSVAHEFMLLNDNGEDRLVLCKECGYSANQEVAECIYNENDKSNEELLELKEVDTGEAKDIAEVSTLLKVDETKCIKAVVYAVKGSDETVVCFIRGDKEVSEPKLKKICKKDIVAFDAGRDDRFTAGNIGPKGLNKDVEVYFDASLKNSINMVTGANKEQKHLVNFNISRDYGNVEYFDLAKVQEGQICPNCKKANVSLSNGIEIGNIFQLGTKYTKSMGMLVKTSDEQEINPIMGCYGIGVGRNLACVIEENCDERGICMPISVAPYKVHICPLRLDDKSVEENAYKLYNDLKRQGIEVLIDDRDAMPGIKFADADLIGMPIRVVISPRSLQNNQAEIKMRKTGETFMVETNKVLEKILELLNSEK